MNAGAYPLSVAVRAPNLEIQRLLETTVASVGFDLLGSALLPYSKGHPWVVVSLPNLLIESIDAVEPRLINLWTDWPASTPGLLVLGLSFKDYPAFFVPRDQVDLRPAIASLRAMYELIPTGRQLFLWKGNEWSAVYWTTLRELYGPDDDSQGAGDRSPLLGGGPLGSIGAAAEIPDLSH